MPKQNDTGPGGVPIKSLTPVKDIGTAKQMWIGRPKVGKTSTAAAIGKVSKKYDLGLKPFFLLFEKGTDGVEIEGTVKPCPECKGTGKSGKKRCINSQCREGVVPLILESSKEMREWFEWAANSDRNPIVIDTGNSFAQAVVDAMCVDQNIASPVGGDDHGVTWYLATDMVRELLGILVAANKGVIITMHVHFREKRVKGGTSTVATFNVSGQKIREFLQGFPDQILFFDVVPKDDGDGDKHVVFAQPQAGIDAGDRWGLFPPELDLGNSAEEGAEAILETFGYLES